MRENFHLMKALAVHTCISPGARIDKLLRFNGRLRQEPKVLQELKDWNMTLDSHLLQVPGRVLPSEHLVFANNRIESWKGDWTTNMRKARLLQSKELRNWIIIGNQRDIQIIDVSNFN